MIYIYIYHHSELLKFVYSEKPQDMRREFTLSSGLSTAAVAMKQLMYTHKSGLHISMGNSRHFEMCKASPQYANKYIHVYIHVHVVSSIYR